MLTAARLRELLHYDPETGCFTRRVSRRSFKAGTIAWSLTHYGYIRVVINKIEYRASRLAWFYMTGEWPDLDIDHKNRNRADDRWENLREATRSQNGANMLFPTRPNKHGFKGVWKQRGIFYAAVTANAQRHYLGHFRSAEEAHAAYVAKAKELFGEFHCAG